MRPPLQKSVSCSMHPIRPGALLKCVIRLNCLRLQQQFGAVQMTRLIPIPYFLIAIYHIARSRLRIYWLFLPLHFARHGGRFYSGAPVRGALVRIFQWHWQCPRHADGFSGASSIRGPSCRLSFYYGYEARFPKIFYGPYLKKFSTFSGRSAVPPARINHYPGVIYGRCSWRSRRHISRISKSSWFAGSQRRTTFLFTQPSARTALRQPMTAAIFASRTPHHVAARRLFVMVAPSRKGRLTDRRTVGPPGYSRVLAGGHGFGISFPT